MASYKVLLNFSYDYEKPIFIFFSFIFRTKNYKAFKTRKEKAMLKITLCSLFLLVLVAHISEAKKKHEVKSANRLGKLKCFKSG